MALTQEKIDSIAACFAATGFLNQEQALIKAGYSKSYARCGLSRKIYANIRVKEAINKLKEEMSEKTELTGQYVINELKDIAEDQKSKAPAVAVRAFELLGKVKGIFEADNAQKQPQTANIAFIDGTRTAIEVEEKLIKDMANAGNALCEG